MPPETCRVADFAPLHNFDAENVAQRFSADEIGEVDEMAPTQVADKQCFERAMHLLDYLFYDSNIYDETTYDQLWIPLSYVNSFMHDSNCLNSRPNSPLALTIAFRSFALLLLVYSISIRIGTEAANTNEGRKSIFGIRRPSGDWVDLMPNERWLVMIPAALAGALSLPMFLEGLLHMPSLPVLIMLFPVIYAAESILLFISCSPSRSQKWLPFESIITAAASSAVLYNEYRLMVPGLIWGVTGILLVGVSRSFFIIGSERAGSELAIEARLRSYHGFVVMTLFFGLILSGIAAYFFESIKGVRNLPYSSAVMILVNIIAVTGSFLSGTTLLAYSPISFENAKPEFSNIPLRGLDCLASTLSSLIVVLVAIHSYPVSYVSWVQIAAYLTAMISLIGGTHIHNMVLTAMDLTQQGISKTLNRPPSEARKPSRLFTAGALFLLIIFFSWSISSLTSASINSIPPSLLNNLDTTYKAEFRFDIVVSMYEETPASVKKMLDEILSTSYLSSISPNIILYTKSPTANLHALKEATGAHTVERLSNLGREGGTYLHHIVNNWDKLAEQTLFIQAHAHNMRELIPRINDYLVPETGMLSLGFTGVLCDCNTCGDRWGWEDNWAVVPALYEKIYNKPCEADTPILLSYKGQFIASARRIRGISRNVYGGLLDTITSTEGWSHDENIVGSNEDSADNPYFGFTVERTWSLLMQCATDGGVAARCPSLLSGMGRAGSVGDCQCLDEFDR